MRELRVAARALLRTPLFATLTILVLTIAMGLNTVMFSVLHATLLKPLPYRDASRLVTVIELERGRRTDPLTPFDFDAVRREASSLSGATGYRYQELELSSVSPPRRVTALHVLDGFFDFLGVAPQIGRTLSGDDFFTAASVDEGLFTVADAVVLGHGLWLRQFGGSTDVIGQRLRLNDESVTVVGVMPQGFDALWGEAELYLPWVLPPGFWSVRPPHVLPMLARLDRDATLDEANAELATLYGRLAVEHPDTNAVLSARAETIRSSLSSVARPVVVLFAGAVAVLLIACANLSGLMATRARARLRDIAVRRALGAGVGSLLRALTAEAMILTSAGAFAGFLLARLAIPSLDLPASIPFEPQLHGVAAGFTLAMMTLTVLVIGVTPAWRVMRTDLTSALKGAPDDASARRAESAFVVVQIGLALCLVATSGVLIRSVGAMVDEGLGSRTEGVLTFDVTLPESRYRGDEDERLFRRRALASIRALPGVVSADTASHLPGGPVSLNLAAAVEGSTLPRGSLRAAPIFVSHGLLDTLGIEVLRGRGFTVDDSRDSPWVIVVNETMAATFWPGDDPLGRRVRLEYDWAPDAPITVVGLSRDVRQESVGVDVRPAFYILHEQFPQDVFYFAVRTRGAPEALIPSLRERMAELDPSLPMTNVRTMGERLERALSVHEMRARLASVYAGGALFLATLGLYGSLAGVVTARSRELVIRIALGATRADVIRLILRSGLRDLGLGLAIGLALTFGLARFISSVLYEIESTDAATLTVTTLCLAGCGLAAAYVPASRAAGLDPAKRLRAD